MPDQFTSQDVEKWLGTVGMDQYWPLFRDQAVSMEMIANLTDADLKELGVLPFGHRKLLLFGASQLKTACNPGNGSADWVQNSSGSAEVTGISVPAVVGASGIGGDQMTIAPAGEGYFSEPGGLPAALTAFRAASGGMEAGVVPIEGSNPSMPVPPPSAPVVSQDWIPEFKVSVPLAGTDRLGGPSAPRKRLVKRFGGKFLLFSIIAHLLFGLVATYLVVQTMAARRKLTFAGGQKGPNASTRALEHSVSIKKKANAGGAPAQSRRILTTGLAKVVLPDMPVMPSSMTVVTSGQVSGLDGMGTGMGFGVGSGFGGGGGGGGGGGNLSFFGLRQMAQSATFIIDISGSMISGKKDRTAYERLENEAIRALNSLPDTARFNIVMFAWECYSYSKSLIAATPDNKAKAIVWLRSYSPVLILPKGQNKGSSELWTPGGAGQRHAGTNSGLALEKAFETRPETIFFVSDGEPVGGMSVPEIFSALEGWQKKGARKVVINTIAYKADSGSEFMATLATKTGGKYKDIE